MGCKLCLDEPYKDKLCVRCYARRVHKRITKALRGTLEEGDRQIFIIDDGSAPAKVLEHVVRKVLENSDREISTGPTAPDDVDRILVPDTVDVVLAHALKSIATRGVMNPYPAKERRPLARLTIEECELVADQWGLSFEKRAPLSFPGLDEVEKNNPGIKATLAKALELF